MPNCVNYDCNDPLGTQLLNDCGEELLGGGSGALLLECDHQLTDPSSAVEIAAEIAAGRATLFKNVKIGIDQASPIEVDSNVSCGTSKLVNYDRTGTWIDGNVNSANVTLYDKVYSGRTFGGMVIYQCGTAEADSGELVEWIDAAITVTGSKLLPNTNNEFQTFNGTFKWRKKTMPSLHTAPVGIF